MMKMNAAGDPGLGLKAGDIGGDEIAARAVEDFAERKQCRQYRRRRMAAERIADIVKIERMRGGAVDQRGVEGRRATGGAKDQAVAAVIRQYPGDDLSAGL